MNQGFLNHEPEAPSVTATRGEPAGRVTRNHVLFGLAVATGLVAVLVFAAVL